MSASQPFTHSSCDGPAQFWLTEQGANKIGKWDPVSQKFTNYQDIYTSDKGGYGAGSKHTLRFDPNGNVWSSGSPLTRLDKETGKFTRFPEVAAAYDAKPDKNGEYLVYKAGHPPDWHGGMENAESIVVYTADGKIVSPGAWRSITTGSCGSARDLRQERWDEFDPKTQTFKEYPLPGPEPTPYGMGIDANGYIWYASYNTDVIGRFDPKTGNTIEYPFPHSENTIREFFRDAQGRMWYGSPSNNKVGYFTVGSANERASK